MGREPRAVRRRAAVPGGGMCTRFLHSSEDQARRCTGRGDSNQRPVACWACERLSGTTHDATDEPTLKLSDFPHLFTCGRTTIQRTVGCPPPPGTHARSASGGTSGGLMNGLRPLPVTLALSLILAACGQTVPTSPAPTDSGATTEANPTFERHQSANWRPPLPTAPSSPTSPPTATPPRPARSTATWCAASTTASPTGTAGITAPGGTRAAPTARTRPAPPATSSTPITSTSANPILVR